MSSRSKEMEGKGTTETYTVLSEVDHKKTPIVDLMGVITAIVPTLWRNKLLNVTLTISDGTLHNPGFPIKILLPTEELDQFLKFGKEGSIIELLEIKIVKNDGEVYGEVTSEEEVRLFSDRKDHIKWYSDEENCNVTGKRRSTIKALSYWKELNFDQMDKSFEDLDKSERGSKKYRSTSNLAETSTSGSPPEKRICRLRKDSRSLESDNIRSKMLRSISSTSLHSTRMRGKNSMTRHQSTSKLPSVPLTLKETPKVDAKNKKTSLSRVDGNSSPNSSTTVTKKGIEGAKKSSLQDHSQTLGNNNEADRVMLRSKSTGSLPKALSITQKTSNKKVEQNVMSKARDSEKGAEIKGKQPLLMSVSTGLLKSGSVETPKGSGSNAKTKSDDKKQSTNKEIVLDEEHSSVVSDSSEKSVTVIRQMKPVYLNSSDSSITYSSQSEDTEPRTNTKSQKRKYTKVTSENESEGLHQTPSKIEKSKKPKLLHNSNSNDSNQERKIKCNPDCRKSNVAASEEESSKKRTHKTVAPSLPVKTTPPQNDKNKLTRRSVNKGAFDTNNDYLDYFTRKLYFKQACEFSEVSEREIEHITAQEKFDLKCKVISQFSFFEEDIQVVRVQDGSVQKCKCLVIPECSSWQSVVERVSTNPVVEAKLPFIDIIIFEFSRMERVITGEYYELQNIMAIKFKPKVKLSSKGDMFFCAKGQDVYRKKLTKSNVPKEIKEKLEEKQFQTVWNSVLDDEGKVSIEKILKKHTHSACQREVRNDENSPSVASVRSHGEKTDAKRKLIEESDLQLKEKSQVVANELGTTSEDVHLSETPTELREIAYLLQQEEEMMKLSETKDVHLKNSGSEVTFSQFCRGAETKATHFRTSTQQQNVSEDIVAESINQCNTVEESLQMEPLEYYSSSSSASSIVCISTPKQSKKRADSEKCSESVLKPLSENSRSKVKPNHSKPGPEKNKSNLPNHVDIEEINICDSESVNIISSKSSDSNVQVVTNINSSEIERIPMVKEACQTNSNVKEIFDVSENSESTSLDFFLPGRNNNQESGGNSKENQTMVEEIDQGKKSEGQKKNCISLKNIPDKYFYKAPSNISSEQEEENSVHNEDDGFVYCTYSLPKNKTFLDFGCIRKIMDKNYITIKAVVNSTKPVLTALWKSEIIKAECPTCLKLYSLNTATGSTSCDSAPLFLGSHVVCPDSQCCNQILENPKFHLSIDLKLKDGKVVTALIKNEVLEKILGCSAEEVGRDEDKFKKAHKTMKKLARAIGAAEPLKVDITRENICDHTSGPLYLLNMYL